MTNIIIGSLATAIITKTIHKHAVDKTAIKLLNCRYCMSHWVGLFVWFILAPSTRYNNVGQIFTNIVVWFAIVAGANLILRLIDDNCTKALEELEKAESWLRDKN